MKIFVTGGAGFIGTHTCVELLKDDHDILVYDNLSNGFLEALKRVEIITNKKLKFINGDIRNLKTLENAMLSFCPNTVIHFAGLKSVSESTKSPLEYYNVNVFGTLQLLKSMEKVGCNNIIFSSSATVYGKPDYLPFDESHKLSPESPYGFSKLMVEQILKDWVKTNGLFKVICLRYFNPVGAHPTGLIGESTVTFPNNLMPILANVALEKLEYLPIFGDDYPTKDGTCVRDYIHVMDVAFGHAMVVKKLKKLKSYEILNLGTGYGTSVMERVDTFRYISGKNIKTRITSRRNGDVAEYWANPTLINKKLGIKFLKNIEDMCEDTWNWKKKYPNGYRKI